MLRLCLSTVAVPSGAPIGGCAGPGTLMQVKSDHVARWSPPVFAHPRPPAPPVAHQLADVGLSATHTAVLGSAAAVAVSGRDDPPGVDRVFMHGAVLVRQDSVLSYGRNRLHPEGWASSRRPGSVHAEVAAVMAAKVPDRRGATLYVVRVTPGGWLAMSRPCRWCYAVLAEHGVSRVVYTNASGVTVERLPGC